MAGEAVLLSLKTLRQVLIPDTYKDRALGGASSISSPGHKCQAK